MEIETKQNFEPRNELDIQMKEERRKQVDNRKQVMHELGLRDDHPHFIEMKDQLERLSLDMQVLFYPKLKEECDIFDEEFREFSKSYRLKLKLHKLKSNRSKH